LSGIVFDGSSCDKWGFLPAISGGRIVESLRPDDVLAAGNEFGKSALQKNC
jgi:hypothetical protein